jgi:pyroglutamyl-peptidase
MSRVVLVTAFEPFGGETVNASDAAMRGLPRQHEDWRLRFARLPTAFGSAVPALFAAIEMERPDLVLCLGEAGGRAHLSLERVAINRDDARIADNAGERPVDRPVIVGGPERYDTSLPVEEACAAMLAAGILAEISDSAGAFVCNHVFYHLMHRVAGSVLRGGFVHVPYLPEQAARHGDAPALAASVVVEGLKVLLDVTAERWAG